MGKLIVLDGLDASGKETQTNLLVKALGEECKVRKIQFPDYDKPSSALVKMYLGGEFGTQPEDVSAYAASTFYAVDRYASFKTDWKKDYESGTLILADRYTTSNAIHQASKLEGEARKAYFDWLLDFEYGLLGLPKADVVFFLHMPVEVALGLMKKRYQNDESKKDIHEKNAAYLEKCYESAMLAKEYYGWQIIECCEGNTLRSIEDIHGELLEKVKKQLMKR